MSGAIALRSVAVGLAVLLVAGCTGPAKPLDTPTSSAPVAATATATADTGSISGTVVDDEQRPVPDVDIAALAAHLETKTDVKGAFTFNELAPGVYSIVANRLGYEAAGKKVTVEAGGVANVTLTLRPVAMDEAYHVTDQKTAYIHVSWLYLTYGLWGQGINNTDLNQLQCDPCRFTILHAPKQKAMLTETLFKNSVTYPVVNNQVWLYYGINDANGYGTGAKTGYFKQRTASAWSDDSVKVVSSTDKMGLWVSADLAGINYEQRVDTFTTFGYGGPLENVTALPPP